MHIILLLGSSASGKSRLVRDLQLVTLNSGLDLGVSIPERFTTRSPRVKETRSDENSFLSEDEFLQRINSGQIDVHWERTIGSDRRNLYGFSLSPYLTSNRMILLAGNNYLNWESSELLSSFRRKGLLNVIRVLASDETRAHRLSKRRPRLSLEEFKFRMADRPAAELPKADFVISNDMLDERHAPWKFIDHLSTLAHASNLAAISTIVHRGIKIGVRSEQNYSGNDLGMEA